METIKIQTFKNFDLQKLKNPDSGFDYIAYSKIIISLIDAAQRKVKRSFKSGKDILGKRYIPLTTPSAAEKKEAGFTGPIMVRTGRLSQSIGKMKTKKSRNKFSAGFSVEVPDSYHIKHLTGVYDKDNRFKKKGAKIAIRKWFFTDEEIEGNKILKEKKLLKKTFDKGIKDLKEKILSEVKTEFRKLGKEITIKI